MTSPWPLTPFVIIDFSNLQACTLNPHKREILWYEKHTQLQELLSAITALPKIKKVALTLPHETVLLKKITLQAATLKELEAEIYWEAPLALSIPLSDIYFDYQLLSPWKTEYKISILLIAAVKKSIDPHALCLKNAGLHLSIVDVESFALARAIHALDPTLQSLRWVLIIQEQTEIFVYYMTHQLPLWTRQLNITALHLLEQLLVEDPPQRLMCTTSIDLFTLLQSKTPISCLHFPITDYFQPNFPQLSARFLLMAFGLSIRD